MKRILQVVGTMDRAGAETMVMNLYRALDKTKFQFDFVYFTEKKCAFDDEIIALGGHIFRISNKNSKSPLKRTYELFQLIKINKYEIVHCHQLLSNSFHLIAAYLGGANKRIAHAHSTKDFYGQQLIRKIYKTVSKTTISIFATDYIACGKEAGEFLFFKTKKIILIPNAIDIEKFLNAKEKYISNFFSIENYTENTLIIAQIGRLIPVKNVEFSLQFAQFLRTKKLDFHIIIVGAGELLEQLKLKVVELHLHRYISFMGVRSDIDAVLANSEVLLMPSKYEGFPVILVEAQASGTPALISNRIAAEVDLGLDLIQFNSLEAPFDMWFESLTTLAKEPKVTKEERMQVLKERGFDINISVKVLEKIYDKE